MKKIIVLILTLAVSICFVACSSQTDDNEESSSEQATSATTTTTTLPPVSTTKQAEKNSSQASSLKNIVCTALNCTEDEIDGDIDLGSFTYKANETDESTMYSEEYSDELEDVAKENAKDFVDSIREYYPDCDDIAEYTVDLEEIGGGDNGIDSVNYIITYLNTQNQALTIYLDSTGQIFYADCEFTW
ncbi:MAG: hypothetical protein LIO62_06955 [Clostridiales bacterium]|nr:hypothetical protein [Clostridiales bacterium]